MTNVKDYISVYTYITSSTCSNKYIGALHSRLAELLHNTNVKYQQYQLHGFGMSKNTPNMTNSISDWFEYIWCSTTSSSFVSTAEGVHLIFKRLQGRFFTWWHTRWNWTKTLIFFCAGISGSTVRAALYLDSSSSSRVICKKQRETDRDMVQWYNGTTLLTTDYTINTVSLSLTHGTFSGWLYHIHFPLYVCCWACVVAASSSELKLTPSLPWIEDFYYHTHMPFCACSQTKATVTRETRFDCCSGKYRK